MTVTLQTADNQLNVRGDTETITKPWTILSSIIYKVYIIYNEGNKTEINLNCDTSLFKNLFRTNKLKPIK